MKYRKYSLIILILISSSYLWAFSAFSYSFNGTGALKPSYMPTSYAKSVSHIKGEIGEYFTEDYISLLKKTGWVSINPRNAVQGIDHVFLKFRSDGNIGDLIIGETKFKNGSPSSYLGATKDGWQMSHNWTKQRMYRDVIPQYTKSPYLVAEDNNLIVLSRSKPQPNKIEKGSKVDIDNNSFYYKRKGDSTLYFFDGDNKYNTYHARTSQMKRVGETLTTYIDGGYYKRRLFAYEFTSENTLIQKIYDVVENSSGEKPKLVPGNTFKERKFTSTKAKASVVNSEEFKQSMLSKLGMVDADFFDIINVDSKLSLINGVNSETGRKILSSQANRAALATRYGLNQNIDFNKISFTDDEMKKLFSSNSFDDLPTNISSKLSKASIKTTLGNAALFGGIGLITSFASEMVTNGGNLNQVDWVRVGYTTGIMAASSLLQRGAQKAVFTLISDTSRKAATMGIITKIAPVGFAIGIDTLTDLAFTGIALYKGDYSLKQAAAVMGLNLVTNTAIYFLAGAAAGSLAGPLGTVVGGSVAVVLSLGSIFIINPFTKKIELSEILSSLKNSREETICKWTSKYLNL